MNYRLGDTQPHFEGDGHYVAPNAALVGDLVLGARSSVWFNVVVRADGDRIRLGEACNLQDGAVLHVDPGFPITLGRGVSVGHKAMVHGCTVGDYSLIGINAVVLNGARIGRYCVIGANALVTEGAEIPDYSVVMGTPGKVRKSLSEEEARHLEQLAAHYVENGRRYREDLVPLPANGA